MSWLCRLARLVSHHPWENSCRRYFIKPLGWNTESIKGKAGPWTGGLCLSWSILGLFFNQSTGCPSMVQAVSKVMPSTVQVRVELSKFGLSCVYSCRTIIICVGGKRLEAFDKILHTNGTGFVIDKQGTILTNAHVVADMLEGGHLRIIYHDGVGCWGEIIGIDLPSDLALVRPWDAPCKVYQKYPPVAINFTKKIKVGEAVATIGRYNIAKSMHFMPLFLSICSPLGLRNSVSTGIVAAVDRSSEEVHQADNRIRYLQGDLNVHPGSSGGPLFTCDGHVIGIITTKADVPGISIAIKMNENVEKMIEQLRDGCILRPYLGIKGISLNEELFCMSKIPTVARFLIISIREC